MADICEMELFLGLDVELIERQRRKNDMDRVKRSME